MRPPFRQLSTGVPGLDKVLGGGLPEYSFNLIAGEPGAGKTTLAHQIMFANATPDRPALYFTILGEPALKMLRYQQRMAFFDAEKVGKVIQFLDLSQVAMEGDLAKVLEVIIAKVEETRPSVVIVDSFRSVGHTAEREEMGLRGFLQRLALFLTSWQATTFLVGEYFEHEIRANPILTVADGILWLNQSRVRNSVVRKLQVMKVRGQDFMHGLHTFRITPAGLQVFERIQLRRLEPYPASSQDKRLATGVRGLDPLLNGGFPLGDSVLVAGPAGTGKTVLCTHFVAEGVQRGEAGVLVVFEEHPRDYLRRAKSLGFDLESMEAEGKLRTIYLRPLDLSVDETLYQVREAVAEVGAERLVIDSLSGFEVALAPTFRDDFRESMYRMVGALTGAGVTIMMTVEITEAFTQLNFSPHAISFLTQNILLLRYAEMEGQLRRVMTVVKMRNSQHSSGLHDFRITQEGMVVGEPLKDYHGILTGVPRLTERAAGAAPPGLTAEEAQILRTLTGMAEASSEVIVRDTGLEPQAVARGLARLVALNYALETRESGETVYRVLARDLG